MLRLKVLNTNEINDLLNDGKILRYATVYGKVYIQDKDWNILGAVKFDTYLKMLREKKIVPLKSYSPIDVLYVIDTPCVTSKACCNAADEATANYI